jgi:hypothetical protein
VLSDLFPLFKGSTNQTLFERDAKTILLSLGYNVTEKEWSKAIKELNIQPGLYAFGFSNV